jgi:hypothetical protein
LELKGVVRWDEPACQRVKVEAGFIVVTVTETEVRNEEYQAYLWQWWADTLHFNKEHI